MSLRPFRTAEAGSPSEDGMQIIASQFQLVNRQAARAELSLGKNGLYTQKRISMMPECFLARTRQCVCPPRVSPQFSSCSFAVLLGCLFYASIAQSQERPVPGQVNTEHSRVYIFVDKTGVVGHQHSIEGKLANGNIFQKDSREGSLVFDMKSFDADTPKARKYLGLEGTTDEPTRQKVNANMLGAEILNVGKYPTAKFEKVTFRAKNTKSKRQLPEYVLAGDFTLHEKTRHVEILCDVEEKDGWHHVRGGFKILQSDYGIKPFSKMLGAVGVTDELTIYGDLWVVPE